MIIIEGDEDGTDKFYLDSRQLPQTVSFNLAETNIGDSNNAYPSN